MKLLNSYLELFMQIFDVIFYSLYQLSLIFSDGTSYMLSDKQGIETREDAEHLVGILGSSKLIPQTSCYSGFHPVYSFIISGEEKKLASLG